MKLLGDVHGPVGASVVANHSPPASFIPICYLREFGTSMPGSVNIYGLDGSRCYFQSILM
jgi:hypothetical protein